MSIVSLYHQLRIKGWCAVTLYAIYVIFINDLKGIDLSFSMLIASLFFLNGFVYLYNDYHDAPFDRLDDIKRKRNVFCGDDQRKILVGKIVLYATPLLSIMLALFVPFRCAMWVFVVLVIGYMYSSPHFRWKERPFWDWFFHILWLTLMFVPAYLYFFKPDLLFYMLFAVFGINSLISQINNEFNDFAVDTLSKHRTTAIIIGKKNTFYLRWVLDFTLFVLLATLAIRYHYYIVLAVLIPTYVWFTWVERIQALNKINELRDFIRIRTGYLVTFWATVWLLEAGIKKLV